MPKKLYNEDGDEVEVPSDEEIAEIKAKAERAEEMEKLISEKEDELKRLKSKDFNFSHLRNKTKEEKDELMKNWDGEKKLLAAELEDLRGTVESYHTSQMTYYEDEVIKAMAGDDQDLKTKLKETAKEFVGTPKTKDEIFARYKNAYTLIQGSAPKVNPINQFIPATSDSRLTSKPKRFTETETGKEAYSHWFPDSPSVKKEK